MNKRFLQILIVLGLAVAITTSIYYRDSFSVEQIEVWIEQAGILAPLVFILIYIVATVLFLPGSVFTLAGGVLFGPYLGVLYNLIGATIGASISFVIARYIASDWVSNKSGGIVKQLINGVEAEGWRFVAFTRLVPLFPFNVLNYALGLTKIRFSQYAISTFIFIIPGCAAYTYLGYAGKEALSGGDDVIKTILIAIALLAVVMFLPRFITTVRRGPSIDVKELKRRIEARETLVLDVRSEKEYNENKIEQAMNIPVEVLDQQIEALDPYREKSISIVCRTDKRSAVAATKLLKHGFQDVRVVRGGMTDWVKS